MFLVRLVSLLCCTKIKFHSADSSVLQFMDANCTLKWLDLLNEQVIGCDDYGIDDVLHAAWREFLQFGKKIKNYQFFGFVGVTEAIYSWTFESQNSW